METLLNYNFLEPYNPMEKALNHYNYLAAKKKENLIALGDYGMTSNTGETRIFTAPKPRKDKRAWGLIINLCKAGMP